MPMWHNKSFDWLRNPPALLKYVVFANSSPGLTYDWPCPCATVDPAAASSWYRVVPHQRLDVGAARIRVGRRCHECSVQVDIDLTEGRTKPVIHRTLGIGIIEVGPIGSCYLCLNELARSR